MKPSTEVRISNSTIAGYILSLIASTNPLVQAAKLTELLDRCYPKHTAKAVARTNKALARSGDKSTSHEAAALVNVPDAEMKVLRVIAASHVPLHVYDLVRLTGMTYQSCSPRLSPLETKGLIAVVGVDRSSGHGRSLYTITAAGRVWTGIAEPMFIVTNSPSQMSAAALDAGATSEMIPNPNYAGA